MEPRRIAPRNLRHKQVLHRRARLPFRPCSADRPRRLRLHAWPDGSHLHGEWSGHRHERRRRRGGQCLLHLSRPGRRRGRGRRPAPGGFGRRLPAKAVGRLCIGPASRRRHDPHRQGLGPAGPTRSRRLLRRPARAADANARVDGACARHLFERRPFARHRRLRLMSRRPGARLGPRRQSADRRSARRLYAGTDRPLESGQTPQRPAWRHGRRRQIAFGPRSPRHSVLAVDPTRFSSARQRRCQRVRFGRSCGTTGSIA